MSRPESASRPQFILMIGDEGVLFIPHRVRNQTAPLYVAAEDERGRHAIFAALDANPRVPLTLFVDTLAQDFRRETLPRLNMFDRPRLIARRLRQAFPQAGLSASLNVGHGRTGVLFAGVHENNPVFTWIERLKNHRRDMAPQIALLPVECAGLLARLLPNAAKGWALLLSRQRTGGFRQIVTYDGELVFTRLTPPLPLSAQPREVAETIARDVRASLGYLGRLGLTDATQLQALMVIPQFAHVAVRSAMLPVVPVHFITPEQAVADLDLPFDPGSDYGDLLFAGWLAAKRRFRLPLMLPEMKKIRQDKFVREWGWRAAAVAALAAFLTTGLQTGNLLATLMETRQETEHLASLRQALTVEQGAAASLTEPLERLRQAVERRRLFSEPVTAPWAALQTLDSGIGDEARLVKLDWQDNDGKPADESMEMDVRLEDAAKADRQETVARFQKLTQNIAATMTGYDVRLARYPFPALPDETLSNDASAKNDPNADTAELTIRRAAP